MLTMFAFYALTAVLYVLNIYNVDDRAIFRLAAGAVISGVVSLILSYYYLTVFKKYAN